MTTLVLFLVLLLAATDRDNITVNAAASPRLSASTSTSSVVPHSSPIAKWDEEKKIPADYAVDVDEELLDLIQMTGILDDPLSSWSASASAKSPPRRPSSISHGDHGMRRVHRAAGGWFHRQQVQPLPPVLAYELCT